MRMQAMGMTNPFLLGLGGAVSGGATAALTGGDWGMAAFQGFMVGMFNHGGNDIDDWMTIDKDGEKTILNVILDDVIINGKKSKTQIKRDSRYAKYTNFVTNIEVTQDIAILSRYNGKYARLFKSMGRISTIVTCLDFSYNFYNDPKDFTLIKDAGIIGLSIAYPEVAISAPIIKYSYGTIFDFCKEMYWDLEMYLNKMSHFQISPFSF